MKNKSLFSTIKTNKKFYLMEAAGIGGFVIVAGILTIFLEYPTMPVMGSWLSDYPIIRRGILGIALGLYVGWTIQLFGKLSGTHVNPSVTLAFYRLGYIGITDAVCYVLAQFAGALVAFYLLKWLIGDMFSFSAINYGVTEPKPAHTAMGAFVAEFIISFVLIIATLLFSSSRTLEKYLAYVVGFLIAVYITFELPYSGMSMNPARSFAAAFGVKQWHSLWIYFVSPVAAMWLAAEVFIPWQKHRKKTAGNDYKEIAKLPVCKKETGV